MNILFINSARSWGGGETWLMDVCGGLRERGHRVVIVCREDSDLHRRIQDSPFIGIPLSRWGDFSPQTILRLWKIIRRYNIDVVCSNMEKELRLGGISATLAGVPIIPSREVDAPIKNTRFNRLFYQYVASGLMVNSYATLNTLLNSAPWLERQHLYVVWKGIDPALFSPGESTSLHVRFHFSQNDTLIGFVGRLDEQKGIPTLLEAMRSVVEAIPEARLILAGEGNLREKIVDFARRNALEKHIFLTGFSDNVARFLEEIAFLVMPSYWEGFGYAAIEAMASQKAVIGTHVSSLSEIIDDGTTGILVMPRSPDQLAAAIVKLASSARIRNKMGSAGAAKVRNSFSISTMVEKTETVFRETIRLHAEDAGIRVGIPESVPAPYLQLMRP